MIATPPCRATHYDELAVAAQAGDAAKVRSLLDSGANPNDYDRTYSALMYAAGNGHVEATRTLLARGANVDHRDHNGDRALLWAAQQLDNLRRLEQELAGAAGLIPASRRIRPADRCDMQASHERR